MVGAVREAPKDLEDYGYLMERAVLFATDLGFGTCWLGGTFTQERLRPEYRPGRRRADARGRGDGVPGAGRQGQGSAATVREFEQPAAQRTAVLRRAVGQCRSPETERESTPTSSRPSGGRLRRRTSNRGGSCARGRLAPTACSGARATDPSPGCSRPWRSPTCSVSTWASPCATWRRPPANSGLGGQWVVDDRAGGMCGDSRVHGDVEGVVSGGVSTGATRPPMSSIGPRCFGHRLVP